MVPAGVDGSIWPFFGALRRIYPGPGGGHVTMRLHVTRGQHPLNDAPEF
jgi:hypothetical protein